MLQSHGEGKDILDAMMLYQTTHSSNMLQRSLPAIAAMIPGKNVLTYNEFLSIIMNSTITTVMFSPLYLCFVSYAKPTTLVTLLGH